MSVPSDVSPTCTLKAPVASGRHSPALSANRGCDFKVALCRDSSHRRITSSHRQRQEVNPLTPATTVLTLTPGGLGAKPLPHHPLGSRGQHEAIAHGATNH